MAEYEDSLGTEDSDSLFETGDNFRRHDIAGHPSDKRFGRSSGQRRVRPGRENRAPESTAAKASGLSTVCSFRMARSCSIEVIWFTAKRWLPRQQFRQSGFGSQIGLGVEHRREKLTQFQPALGTSASLATALALQSLVSLVPRLRRAHRSESRRRCIPSISSKSPSPPSGCGHEAGESPCPLWS